MQHPDEGTLHASIDGALSAAEQKALEAHVAGCAECSARLAEARGLVAGASRIVMLSDDAATSAGLVAPATVATISAIAGERARRARRVRWMGIAGTAAAAAMVAFIAWPSVDPTGLDPSPTGVGVVREELPPSAPVPAPAAVAPAALPPAARDAATPPPSMMKSAERTVAPRAEGGPPPAPPAAPGPPVATGATIDLAATVAGASGSVAGSATGRGAAGGFAIGARSGGGRGGGRAGSGAGDPTAVQLRSPPFALDEARLAALAGCWLADAPVAGLGTGVRLLPPAAAATSAPLRSFLVQGADGRWTAPESAEWRADTGSILLESGPPGGRSGWRLTVVDSLTLRSSGSPAPVILRRSGCG